MVALVCTKKGNKNSWIRFMSTLLPVTKYECMYKLQNTNYAISMILRMRYTLLYLRLKLALQDNKIYG